MLVWPPGETAGVPAAPVAVKGVVRRNQELDLLVKEREYGFFLPDGPGWPGVSCVASMGGRP